MERPIDTKQDTARLHPLHDIRGFRSCGLKQSAVADQFDADKQPEAANIADQRVLCLQLTQARHQKAADVQGVILKVFLFDDVEYRGTSCARDRISAKRVEVLHA